MTTELTDFEADSMAALVEQWHVMEALDRLILSEDDEMRVLIEGPQEFFGTRREALVEARRLLAQSYRFIDAALAGAEPDVGF
jgi:hypothetical protein